MTASYFDTLLTALHNRSACVGIIGLGYVGVPLATLAARRGFAVLGFDRDAERVASLNAGQSYIVDVSSAALQAAQAIGQFTATTDAGRLGECDVVIICVPTPLNDHREPDMTFIEAATAMVAATLRPGQLIVLESTTWPGTTEELILPRLVAQGGNLGEDFFLAFSPERVDPGQTGSAGYTVENTPKVVGGVTERCGVVATTLYGALVAQVVPVSAPKVAELTKLFENIFRNVNIALVNELAMLCDRMQINVWEVIDAAATKPFAFMKHTPGPGLGGHCIPLDPFYLAWKAREYGFATRFVELAGEINMEMPRYVLQLVTRALNKHRKSLNGSRVVLLGVAYKKDVDDYRESPVFKLIELLEAEGAEVVTVDPLIETFYSHHGRTFHTTPLSPALLAGADCAVIVTNHSAFSYDLIVQHAPIVVDTRNATKDVVGSRDKIVLL